MNSRRLSGDRPDGPAGPTHDGGRDQQHRDDAAHTAPAHDDASLPDTSASVIGDSDEPGQGSLGERLRNLRQAKRLRLVDLAGGPISYSHISLIERGLRNPSWQTTVMLAARLEVSPLYLTHGLSDQLAAHLQTTLDYGHIALSNGAAAEATARFDEALGYPEIEALPGLALAARTGLAAAAEAGGHLERAIELLDAITTTLDPMLAPGEYARAALALIRCHRDRGDVETAATIGQDAFTHLTTHTGVWSDDVIKLGATLMDAVMRRGDLTYAHQLAERLLDHATTINHTAWMAITWNQAILAEETGHFDQAYRLAGRAIALLGELDDERNLHRLHWVQARILLKAHPHRAREARDLLAQATADLAATPAGILDQAEAHADLADAELALKSPAAALSAATRAAGLLRDQPARPVTAHTLTVLAHAHTVLGHHDQALTVLADATAVLGELAASRDTARTWSRAADLYHALGKPADEAHALKQALSDANL